MIDSEKKKKQKERKKGKDITCKSNMKAIGRQLEGNWKAI